jgi:hypothetical protein
MDLCRSNELSEMSSFGGFENANSRSTIAGENGVFCVIKPAAVPGRRVPLVQIQISGTM